MLLSTTCCKFCFQFSSPPASAATQSSLHSMPFLIYCLTFASSGSSCFTVASLDGLAVWRRWFCQRCPQQMAYKPHNRITRLPHSRTSWVLWNLNILYIMCNGRILVHARVWVCLCAETGCVIMAVWGMFVPIIAGNEGWNGYWVCYWRKCEDWSICTRSQFRNWSDSHLWYRCESDQKCGVSHTDFGAIGVGLFVRFRRIMNVIEGMPWPRVCQFFSVTKCLCILGKYALLLKKARWILTKTSFILCGRVNSSYFCALFLCNILQSLFIHY